jgi:hypothetical protein
MLFICNIEEGRGDSTTPVIGTSKSGSFSSLKPENPSERCSVSSTGRQSKGSHNSLLAIPDASGSKSPNPESKRKSSWTDIFFPGRTRSKSTSSSPRKSPTDKKKGVFSKILNFGRKSPSKEITSPNGHRLSGIESIDTPRVSVTDTSENEPHEELIIHSPPNEPTASEQDIIGILEAVHSQMDRTPVEDMSQNEVIPSPLPPLNLRKTLKRRESTIDDEVQSLPEILPSSRSKDKHLILSSNNSRNTETVVVQIESCARDDNSSESEMGFDESKLKIKKNSTTNKSVSESEDDFEAENLLTQDSIDYDEMSGSENIATNFSAIHLQQELVKSPIRKERLEITTIPIERPRSTTPINIVPLEAYIRSSSISPDPNLEKIKLSLPGEQFTASARAKSPRKSNPSIWFEFCEKGLQSPLTRRKQRANSCFTGVGSQNPFSVTNIDAFTSSQALTPSPGNLTPVTPLEGFNDNKWPGFGDNFVDLDNLLAANGVNNDNDKFSCKCDCNLSLNINETIDANKQTDSQSPTSVSTPPDESNNKNSSVSTTEHEYMEDQPLVSPCHCLCHRRADFALSLWKSSSLNKQESVSSDISSASSRLIGSSSDNSKCSPTEDIIELNS